MAQQISDPTLITLDVKPTGALSGARDRYLQSQDPHYLVVTEKIGSEWKLAADIWNGGK
jgi:hypothetical protein